MQTIYTTSYRLGVRDNVIDLNAYRRRMEMRVEEPEEIEVEPLLWATQQEERPVRRSRARRAASGSAWAMDIMASAGVLAMTMVFTMAVL